MSAGPKCIVCGRPIAKRTTTYFFRLPRAAMAASAFNSPMPAIEPGDRTTSTSGNLVTLCVAELPVDRADLQRLINGQIVSIGRAGGKIDRAGAWDGESYRDNYFDTGKCAERQGYASARHGERFTWGPK